MTSQTIEGPQGALFLDHNGTGRGKPILFVHSDGGSLHHWDEIRAHLAGRPTAAFDRRGHGNSQAPRNGSFEHADAAQDIGAVADALCYDRFILVGHSGGGGNAFAFAGLNPGRLAGLVLVDPISDPAALPPGMIDQTLKALGGDNYEATVEQYYRSIAGDDPAVAERLLADIRSTSRETLMGTFRALASFRPREYAGRFKGPTLSIIQSQFNVDGALHRIPPGFDHVAIDGAGHWIHLGAPRRFAQILDSFLDREGHGRNRARAARVADRHATPDHPS